MKRYSLFEILGPTMIGPSSSHTAGAARLGKMARSIYGKEFERADLHLHGSFQTTYEGHGSDRAFVGGLLGYEPDDERLIDSLETAKEKGIEINFKMIDLGFVHPNSVMIELFENKDSDKSFTVSGSSIGGGKMEIFDIDGINVRFKGERPTIIAEYDDRFGMIRDICVILTDHNISIADLTVRRENNLADMVMELDQPFNDQVIESIKELDNMLSVLGIMPL